MINSKTVQKGLLLGTTWANKKKTRWISASSFKT